MRTIYVKLLNEGVDVYRPVRATPLPDGRFRIDTANVYDRDDEEWEFEPGSIVQTVERTMDGDEVLVAVMSSD